MNKFSSSLKLISAGILLSVGLSYAATWTAPTQQPPTGLDTPITVLSYHQEKPGGLSVNTFAALGNSQLKQQAFLRGPVKAIDPGSSDPTLEIGSVSTPVVTTANGNINSGQTIGATNLINSNLDTLCATDTGWVVRCGTTTVTNPPVPPGPVYYASCFVADTMVTLANGVQKKIQDVKMGDILKGDTTNNKVLGFHQPTLGDNKLYAFNGGDYFVTAEHPFLTTTGWKSIDPTKTKKEHIGITVTPLKVGDILVTDKGLVKIKTIASKAAPASTQLYNFVLDGDHTYFADGYLVHNKTAASSGAPTCSPTGSLPCAIPTSSDGRQLNPGTIGLGCNSSGPTGGGWGVCPAGTSPLCSSSGIQLCQ
jgi:hypothetical protein